MNEIVGTVAAGSNSLYPFISRIDLKMDQGILPYMVPIQDFRIVK
jgi:hypothetical protein